MSRGSHCQGIRRTLGLALLVFLLSACQGLDTQPQTPNAVSHNVFALPSLVAGIEENNIDPQNAVEHYRQLGVSWIRRNGLLWSAVEPSPGERRWEAMAALERELARYDEANFAVILIVRSTPTWAQATPGSSCGAIQPEQLSAFAEFMYDVVKRYSAPPFNVHTWELWNEPDVDPALVQPNSVFGCWGDATSPRYGGEAYAEMLQAVYPRIKAADPGAQVLVGGLLLDCDPFNPPETSPGSGNMKDCSASRFLEGVLENGGGAYFDGISFHAYDFYFGTPGQYGNLNWNSTWETTGPVAGAKASYIREMLARYGVAGKFLMNTEQALLCGSGAEETCQSEAYQRTKAGYVAQSYAGAVAEGLTANIWFSLKGWRGSGLVDSDLNPLPAYTAYQVAAHEIGAANFVRQLDIYPGVRVMGFEQAGDAIWLLWAVDGQTHQVRLPAPPTRIRDLYGQDLPLTMEIEVGAEPLYVRWHNLAP